MKSKIQTVILFFLTAVFAVSAFMLVRQMTSYRAGDEAYAEASEIAAIPEVPETETVQQPTEQPPNRPQPYPNTYTPGKAAYRAKRQGKSTPDRTVCSGLWTLSRRWPRARAKAMNDGRRYTI